MPQEQFVVKLNEDTNLYMTSFNPEYGLCQWGNVENAVTFETLAEAEGIAARINSGTVGVPKP